MSATTEHYRWLAGGDTGLSSATIWGVMTDEEPGRYARSTPARPYDADDFGRCARLIERFPEWNRRLGEVADLYPEWGPIVAHWGELERLYRLAALPAMEATIRRIYEDRCCCARYVLGSGPEGERHARNGCEWRETR